MPSAGACCTSPRACSPWTACLAPWVSPYCLLLLLLGPVRVDPENLQAVRDHSCPPPLTSTPPQSLQPLDGMPCSMAESLSPARAKIEGRGLVKGVSPKGRLPPLL